MTSRAAAASACVNLCRTAAPPERAFEPRVQRHRPGGCDSRPGVGATIFATNWRAGHVIAAALVLGSLWYAGISVGIASGRTTLATLGPWVAVARGTIFGFVAVTVIGVWSPALMPGEKASLLTAAAVLLLVGMWESIVVERLTPPKRLLLVGPHEGCVNVIRDLEESGKRGFLLVGIVDGGTERAHDSLVLGGISDLQQVVAAVQPDLIALVPGADRPATFAEILDSAASGFRVLELAQFYEHAFGRVPVRDLTRAWFMSVLHLYQRPYPRFLKRATDLVGAALLLVLTLPLFPVLALLVACTRGPILIGQTRVGEHGRLFTMVKFRTMHQNAELPGQAIWAAANDPRVTTAGRIMRRFRLDELPQIWNVARGEMSIVGPRPERPEFIDDLLESVPYWSRRHLVKPGITGWAQIKRGYTADAAGSLEKLSYDLWYIRHRSLTVDLVICARTFATALRGDPTPARAAERRETFEPVATLLHL